MSEDFNEIQTPVTIDNNNLQAPTGALTTDIVDGVISAKRVDVKRDIAVVMANIKATASVMGEKYYYSWPTKNRDGTFGKVEGGTVKLAMDIARLHGNCQVDCRVTDSGTHLDFHARFVDIESGFSLTRPFRQRKDQNTGMKDKARAEDIILQIGASKAIRNVILNSLPTLAEYALQEAKKGLINRVTRNPEGARNSILSSMEEISLPLIRAEKIIGRNCAEWTVKDMVKLYVQVESIKDGHATLDDIFPDGNENTKADDTKGGDALKEKLKSKKTTTPTEKVETTKEPVEKVEVKEENKSYMPVDIFMPDGVVRSFPNDIDIITLLQTIQDFFPPDRSQFIRDNIDSVSNVVTIMRILDAELSAVSYEKIFKE